MNNKAHVHTIFFLTLVTLCFQLFGHSFNPPQQSINYWNWDIINCNNVNFPKNFLWGAATKAHYIEGNCVNNTQTLWNEQYKSDLHHTTAFDHWNQYSEDIEIMKELGLNTYSFTIEWSKIEPHKGYFDQSAIEHYHNVCKALVAQHIKPIITLYADTEPIWFAYLGSFEKKENIDLFVNFCTTIFTQFQQYDPLWITFNAPEWLVTKKYVHAFLPPGKKDHYALAITTLYHMLTAHTRVYTEIKKLVPEHTTSIGIIKNMYHIVPWNEWNIIDNFNTTFMNRLLNECMYHYFTTGIFKISIPSLSTHRPRNNAACHCLDFIGLSYYSRGFMHNYTLKSHPDETKTDNPLYTIYPEGFYKALKQLSLNLAKPLKIPIYVMENGIATHDEKKRSLFFKRHLYALSQAIKEGIDVRGYLIWSLMDTYRGEIEEKYGIIPIHKPTLLRGEPRHGTAHLFNVVERFR